MDVIGAGCSARPLRPFPHAQGSGSPGWRHRSGVGALPGRESDVQSREEIAAAIKRLAVGVYGLNRCDGTIEELHAYRHGSGDPGWSVAGPRPAVGDLLVSAVSRGPLRVIVSVCRVEDASRRGEVYWSDSSDVSVIPGVPWSEVATRLWSRLEGSAAQNFIVVLCAAILAASDVGEVEGERRRTRCRRRSGKNRARALERANGICEGCALDLGSKFGVRGERALEVHHNVPFSKRGEGQLSTPLPDLTVLCATCHRLLHADETENVEALRSAWQLHRT